MTADELTVDQIQVQRGIGRRYAYMVLRQQREEEYAANPPSTNQRERILTLLYRSAGDISNTNELLVALHADGYSIDGHDVTKTMWSLQKTGHVKFRERQKPRFLFAIKLTPEGEALARSLLERHVEEETVEVKEEIQVEAYIERDRQATEAPALSLVDGHPAIAEVRDRARKAKRLAAAATILEEVGEDEMALTLMGKAEFTMLELEIIDVLEKYQEA